MEDRYGRPADLHSVGGAHVALSLGYDRPDPAAGETFPRPIKPGDPRTQPQTLEPKLTRRKLEVPLTPNQGDCAASGPVGFEMGAMGRAGFVERKDTSPAIPLPETSTPTRRRRQSFAVRPRSLQKVRIKRTKRTKSTGGSGGRSVK